MTTAATTGGDVNDNLEGSVGTPRLLKLLENEERDAPSRARRRRPGAKRDLEQFTAVRANDTLLAAMLIFARVTGMPSGVDGAASMLLACTSAPGKVQVSATAAGRGSEGTRREELVAFRICMVNDTL